MPETVCTCEDWFPHYVKSIPMCFNCELPLSKERSDISASFWETCSPEDFRQAGMYNKSKLRAAFSAWLSVRAPQ
jgi:hypothetical protein